jgi:excisionase family DNA binding protein
MLDLSRKTQHSFWTVKEIVQLTGLSEKTIWRVLASKKLGSVKLNGSRLIRHSQLVEFLGFDPLTEASLVETIVRNKKAEALQSSLPLFDVTEPNRD